MPEQNTQDNGKRISENYSRGKIHVIASTNRECSNRNIVEHNEITISNIPHSIPSQVGEGNTSARKLNKKVAFTLAEVLITLGIIGVVAALTLPSLIENHQKKVVATKLEKFYSVMNQALQAEEAENGDRSNWAPNYAAGDTFGSWYLEHLDKHIVSLDKGVDSLNDTYHHYHVAFKDGTGFDAYLETGNQIDIFYCINYKTCAPESYNGRNTFLFEICPSLKYKLVTSSCYINNNIRREDVLTSCRNGSGSGWRDKRHWCTRLIQMDGWQIKDDYPWNSLKD